MELELHSTGVLLKSCKIVAYLSLLRGGLKPNNVKDAVSSIRPWGIDVSSGVEASPGKKDTSAVVAFVQGAREAAVEASKGF